MSDGLLPESLTCECMACGSCAAEYGSITDLTPEQWAAQHNWGVTTAADCLGQPPDSIKGWALYDMDEDDPPIAIFDFEDDARMVCEILRQTETNDERRTST